MDKKINNFFILGIILIVFCIQFVTSDATLCYQQNPSSGGTKITCNGIGCLWVSNSSAEFALSQTDLYDPYCNWGGHCCMPNECWRFDGNSAGCTNSSDTLNCTYDPFQWKTLGNGTTMYGVCFTDYSTSNTGGAAWSGMTIGCWQYCADYATCTNALNSQKCSWKPNDLNQNPSCHIKTLSEARATRNGAATLDIGCCETKSCMSFDGNESLCVNNTAFKGLCNWKSKVSDPYCPNSVGCCVGKWCSEILDPINCSKMKTDLFMPCNWTGVSTYALGGRCNESVGGAFSFYNDTDSCMSAGGWYNSSGSCITPTTGASGAGGFMFAGTPKCWFADNQKDTCKNVTGCVYCYDATTQLNNYSSACYNRMNGSCQGHENVFQNWNGSNYVTIQDIQSDALSCGNLTLKSACEYGPLPNCVWSNSSTNDGDFCQVGTSTTQRNAPPVSYCDHPLAQNNYTLCLELSQSYLMPCKWGNVSSNRTSADNCTFNQQAVFGAGAATSDIDYTIVSSEMSCIAAGGTWKSEYYLDSDGTFKRDSWCEKGALFNFVTGQAFGNKGNCDSDCWACEFNSTGGAWASTAIAEAACLNSKKGTCQWRTDANAPNKKGWCEYPNDFSFGGTKDCNTDCKGCEYVGNNLANASKACYGSYAGCIWINDSTAINGKEGYCISSSKKSCLTDCNNCYDQSSCSNISSHPSLNCSWDVNIRFCKPYGFTGEVCFNGGDDDNDNTIDCGDTDCTYDQFCGGASVGSGTVDCKKVNMTSCNTTVTSSGKNCTSIPSMYGMEGYCDFPGSNCWIFDDNSASCNRDRGCIYRNSTGGYLNSSLRNADKAFTGYCTINQTKSSQCMNASNSVNATLCALTNTCEWITDTYNLAGGRCDLKVFVKCGNQSITSSLSCYAAGGGNMCTWTNHSGTSTGGWCEPQCKDKTIEDCNSNTYCAAKASMCEPEMFGGMEHGYYGGGGIGGGRNRMPYV